MKKELMLYSKDHPEGVKVCQWCREKHDNDAHVIICVISRLLSFAVIVAVGWLVYERLSGR